MRNGNSEHLAGPRDGGERRGRRLYADVHVTADEAQSFIAHQSAGQKTGFAENLKTIANAEHQASGPGETRNGVHHRREAGNRAGAQVIAVREATGQNDGVKAGEVLRLMPNEFGRGVKDFAYRMQRIVIAIGSREYDNTNFHRDAAPGEIT